MLEVLTIAKSSVWFYEEFLAWPSNRVVFSKCFEGGFENRLFVTMRTSIRNLRQTNRKIQFIASELNCVGQVRMINCLRFPNANTFYGTTNTVYGTTNTDAEVGIGMRRGDSTI